MEILSNTGARYTSIDIFEEGMFITSFVLPTPLWYKLRTVLREGTTGSTFVKLIEAQEGTNEPPRD